MVPDLGNITLVLDVDDPALGSELAILVTDGLQQIAALQKSDGGWGWCYSAKSDDYLSDLGLVHMRRTYDYEKALAAFREVRRLRPSRPDGHLNVSLALSRLGRHEEAIPVSEECIRLFPRYAKARLNRAFLAGETGDARRCVEELKTAHRLGLRTATVHLKLGFLLLRDEPERARRHLDAFYALQAWPEGARYPRESWSRDCDTWSALARRFDAVVQGQEALDDAREILLLAVLCWEWDRPRAAVRFFRDAFERDPRLRSALFPIAEPWPYLLSAACAASAAAQGRGADAEPGDREELFRASLTWLREALRSRPGPAVATEMLRRAELAVFRTGRNELPAGLRAVAANLFAEARRRYR